MLVPVLLLLTALQALAADVAITILHTNDLHQHLEPLPRIAGYVAAYRREHPNTVFVDAGDFFDRGSSLVPMTLGEAMYAAMARMGYDMWILGNHDWVYGGPRVLELMRQYPVPVLGTNLATTRPPLPASFRRILVKELGGIRVGFLGITLDTYGKNPKSRPHLYVLDCREQTASAVAELKQAKVDLIVAVTHLGFAKMKHETRSTHPSDVELAKANPDIDVVVGGHSHTLLPEKKTRVAYEETGAIIVQAGASGRWVGRLTMHVDQAERRIKRFEIEHVRVDAKLPEHPAVASLLEQQYQQYMPNAKEVAGEFRETMEFHNLAYWYADFIRQQAEADLALLPRKSLYDEPTRFGKAAITIERLSGYLYDRYLVKSTVVGADLLKFCDTDHMRDRFNPFHHRGRPFSGDAMFYSGMEVTFEAGDGSVRFGIDPEKEYTLVTPWPFSRRQINRYRHRLPARDAVDVAQPVPGLTVRNPVVLPHTTRQLLTAQPRPLDFYRKYRQPRPDWEAWTAAFEARIQKPRERRGK